MEIKIDSSKTPWHKIIHSNQHFSLGVVTLVLFIYFSVSSVQNSQQGTSPLWYCNVYVSLSTIITICHFEYSLCSSHTISMKCLVLQFPLIIPFFCSDINARRKKNSPNRKADQTKPNGIGNFYRMGRSKAVAEVDFLFAVVVCFG